MLKRTTVDQFIEKAKLIHGNKYRYNKVNYLNNSTKVEIYCRVHKEYFEQQPNNHLQGKGCKKCACENRKTYTTEEFIEKAKKIHGNKYNYDKTVFKNIKLKIDIICNKCGNCFQQIPDNHLFGKGCRKCSSKLGGLKKRIKSEDFITRSKKIHQNNYDYSKVVCEGNTKPVIIKCNKHNIEFKQTPAAHLRGCGCPVCGRERIAQSNIENPKGWTYDNWEKSSLKSKNFDSYKIYIIECYNDKERFIKIGRTYRLLYKRFSNLPYKYTEIEIFSYNNARDACKIEKKLHKLFKKVVYLPKIPFDGMHECFNINIKDLILNFGYFIK